MGTLLQMILCLSVAGSVSAQGTEQNKPLFNKDIRKILELTKPLSFPRGDRLPIYSKATSNPGRLDPESAMYLVKELDKRGIAVICTWDSENRQESLETCLTIARAQQQSGIPVNINATACFCGFYDSTDSTAHIDSEGKPFFDDSFLPYVKTMGCPFRIDRRKDIIREKVEFFAKAYEGAGIGIDFVWCDWEIDGPLDINGCYEASKKCRICRENIKNIDDFGEFQKVMRNMRSFLQFHCYVEPIKTFFPNALIGNYAVYPNDGWRHWMDYFESTGNMSPAHPYIADQKARYRKWYNDFPTTGYTMAMPVCYTRKQIFGWYDFENTDYRWFYNMLLDASNAGKSTPQQIPVVPFVNFDPEGSRKDPGKMSVWCYREFLWHCLLRGTDTFFVWAGPEVTAVTQEVYSESLLYRDFLDYGMPVNFDVPSQQGAVISGLALGDRVLIRRTDFGDSKEPLEIIIGVKKVAVPYGKGKCMVLEI